MVRGWLAVDGESPLLHERAVVEMNDPVLSWPGVAGVVLWPAHFLLCLISMYFTDPTQLWWPLRMEMCWTLVFDLVMTVSFWVSGPDPCRQRPQYLDLDHEAQYTFAPVLMLVGSGTLTWIQITTIGMMAFVSVGDVSGWFWAQLMTGLILSVSTWVSGCWCCCFSN